MVAASGVNILLFQASQHPRHLVLYLNFEASWLGLFPWIMGLHIIQGSTPWIKLAQSYSQFDELVS